MEGLQGQLGHGGRWLLLVCWSDGLAFGLVPDHDMVEDTRVIYYELYFIIPHTIHRI